MKTVILTQPSNSGDALAQRLTENGLNVLRFPLVETKAAPLTEELSSVLKSLDQFTWLIFTSKNAVQYLFSSLKKLQIDFPKSKIAVIGSKTATALEPFGYKAHYTNQGTTSHHFVEELKTKVLQKNTSVLAILGNLAPDTLANGLKELVNFQRINIYETVATAIDETALQEIVSSKRFDRIVFTSPSGVKRMHEILNSQWQKIDMKSICIGSVTEGVLRNHKIEPLHIAEKPTEQGLFDAIMRTLE